MDLAASGPRYVWPLLVAGARAARLAAEGSAGDRSVSEGGAALRARLRGQAEKLEWFGPVQLAHRLTFAAAALDADGQPGAAGPAGPATTAPAGLRDAWDVAAAAWEAVHEPYPLAGDLRLGPRGDEIARLSRRVRPGDGRPLSTDASPDGPGGPAGPAAPAPLGLTARELEVLHLVTAASPASPVRRLAGGLTSARPVSRSRC
jgi:hypothetical protein